MEKIYILKNVKTFWYLSSEYEIVISNITVCKNQRNNVKSNWKMFSLIQNVIYEVKNVQTILNDVTFKLIFVK